MSERDISLGITVGDPAGIGPEVTAKALAASQPGQVGKFLIIGSQSVWAEAVRTFAPALAWRAIDDARDLAGLPPGIYLYQPAGAVVNNWSYGKVSAECGAAVVNWVRVGIRLALDKVIDGLVNAPINKEAINLAGYKYEGHTEILREETGVKRAVMMLLNKYLRVSLVTTHIPLRKVPDAITAERVYETIKITHHWLPRFGEGPTNILVAGLNPHAGEAGVLGEEDDAVIRPAIQRAQAEGLVVEGPLPPDTIFTTALRGGCGAIVAMYHDQGLAPLKTLSFQDVVNVTLGLPIIRTSTGHGTAFDLAGTSQADETSMRCAIKLAYELVVHSARLTS